MGQRSASPGPGAWVARARRLADPVFGVDLRSLGLFRIALASVLLFDLFDRSKSVAAHYTDAGTVPVSVLPLLTGGAKLSIHAWLGHSLPAQWTLLAVSFGAGVALLLGFHTRVAAAVSWFLLASLQVRNPLISWEGADKLLRILLFWGVLAPLGARFSLDARRARLRRAPGLPGPAPWLCTPATALFVLQVAALYWITGMAKTGNHWLDGQALAYVLRNDFFGTPLGAFARQFDGLLTVMSHTSRYLELLAPFLLFVPWRTWAFRLAAMSLFYAFHLGILFLMSVGFFSPISMTMWLPLLPSPVWELAARLGGRPPPADARSGSRLRTPWTLEAPAAVLALFLIASIGVKAVGFATSASPLLPRPVDAAARLLRVRQHWPMFSPNPPLFDAWPVLRGRLADGRLVDPFAGGPVLEDPPPSIGDYYPSFKWKIQFWWLVQESRDQRQPHLLWGDLARYLCDRWNATHPVEDRLARIDLTLRLEVIQPDAEHDTVERWNLPGHACRPAAG